MEVNKPQKIPNISMYLWKNMICKTHSGIWKHKKKCISEDKIIKNIAKEITINKDAMI